MNKVITLLVAGLSPTLVMAQACNVNTGSESSSVPVVASHTCYTFKNMQDNAIDWSCSNESKTVQTITKDKVAQCSDDYQATCVATLTQESLANPNSTSKDKNETSVNIPSDAQVITRYYGTADMKQAKADCELGGGRWEAK